MVQEINICPGVQYDYSFDYYFQGDVSANTDCDVTLWIQGTPISGVYGTFPTDSAGNPTDSLSAGWFTYSGSYTSTYFSQDFTDIFVAIRFHCGSNNVMTFGLDSFTFAATV